MAGYLPSDVESKRAELLAPVLGDLLRAPRRQPHPVDAEIADQALERDLGLVLDDVRERARGAGERHVDGGDPLGVHRDAVNQAEVDHVNAKLGVDDVPERLQQVLDLGADLGEGTFVRLRHRDSFSSSVSAWAVASFQAIQPSSAHLILAGYLATP